jgi:hypothetical protein
MVNRDRERHPRDNVEAGFSRHDGQRWMYQRVIEKGERTLHTFECRADVFLEVGCAARSRFCLILVAA